MSAIGTAVFVFVASLISYTIGSVISYRWGKKQGRFEMRVEQMLTLLPKEPAP